MWVYPEIPHIQITKWDLNRVIFSLRGPKQTPQKQTNKWHRPFPVYQNCRNRYCSKLKMCIFVARLFYKIEEWTNRTETYIWEDRKSRSFPLPEYKLEDIPSDHCWQRTTFSTRKWSLDLLRRSKRITLVGSYVINGLIFGGGGVLFYESEIFHKSFSYSYIAMVAILIVKGFEFTCTNISIQFYVIILENLFKLKCSFYPNNFYCTSWFSDWYSTSSRLILLRKLILFFTIYMYPLRL